MTYNQGYGARTQISGSSSRHIIFVLRFQTINVSDSSCSENLVHKN